MKRRLTLRPKTLASVITVLFLGFSLLFSGCDIFSEPLRTECPFTGGLLEPGFAWQVQYKDFKGNIKVTLITNQKEIDLCDRIMRVTLTKLAG